MEQRQCVVCDSLHGEPVGNGTENWYWHSNPYYVGPFCSKGHAVAFGSFSPHKQMFCLFRDNAVVEAVLRAKVRSMNHGFRLDGIHKMRWSKMRIMPMSEKLFNSELGPPANLARDGEDNRLTLVAGYEAQQGDMG